MHALKKGMKLATNELHYNSGQSRKLRMNKLLGGLYFFGCQEQF